MEVALFVHHIDVLVDEIGLNSLDDFNRYKESDGDDILKGDKTRARESSLAQTQAKDDKKNYPKVMMLSTAMCVLGSP